MTSTFFQDFKTFVIQNNILTTISAVTVAFSFGIFVRSLVGDIIIPGLYFLLFKHNSHLAKIFSPIDLSKIDNFVKEAITLIFVIISTFMIVMYVFKKYIIINNSNNVAGKNIVTREEEHQNEVTREESHYMNNNSAASSSAVLVDSFYNNGWE